MLQNSDSKKCYRIYNSRGDGDGRKVWEWGGMGTNSAYKPLHWATLSFTETNSLKLESETKSFAWGVINT